MWGWGFPINFLSTFYSYPPLLNKNILLSYPLIDRLESNAMTQRLLSKKQLKISDFFFKVIDNKASKMFDLMEKIW